MALTNSQPNNINVPNGNGLVVYIDGETNQVYVRDVRGATEELNVLTESITTIIAEGGLTALKEGSVVTLGTDSTIIQLKAEKGQPNGYASLDANGKLPVSELPVSVLTYEGMWNAATNTPFIQDGVGGAGDFYIVSVGGTQNLGSGPILFEAGDWVIYNGSIWQRNSSNLPNLQEVTDVGATTTNAINTAGITTDYVQLDLAATPTLTVGMARWNTDQLTWEVGLGTGPIAYEMGQSLFYPQVRNTSGTNLPKGTLVMVDPTDVSTGDRLNVVRAVANGTYISQLFVGILAEAINSNATGFAVWFGQIYNIANSAINLGGEAWVEGDILYASAANPGGLTKVEPAAPNLKVTIAAIQAINGGNVNLLVRPWLNEDIGQLNDVSITNPDDNSILQFNSTTGVWEDVAGTTTNIAEGTNLYFTTARARESVSAGDGISYNSTTGVITNSDRGSSQDIFKNIAVATQSTVTADTNNDTLTLAAGTNIGITTNATTDTITFSTINVPTGTGIANYIPLWTTSSNLSTSLLYDNGQNIGLNTALPFSLGANTNSLTIQGTNGAAIELQTNSVGGLRLASSGSGSLAGEVRNLNFDLYANAAAKLGVLATGTIRLYDYGTGTKTGTAAYNLFVDASGNIIEGPGGVIDGSGTTNYVSKFTDSNTIADSIIFDNGTGMIGIGTTTFSATTNYKGITISGTTGAEIFFKGGSTTYGRISASGSGLVLSSETAEPVLIATTAGTVATFNNSGSVRLNSYGTGTKTGTAAFNLSVDASGNIIETAGSVIDGSGTTNYVPKFTDSNTIGNSQIFDSGTNVGIGTATPSQLLHVNGAVRITGSLYDSTNDPGAATEFLSSTGSATVWATAVTSVALSVPTGFGIANSPVTTSGTLALSFAAGYSLPTDARQTEWDNAYNDSITAFAYNTGTALLTLTQRDLGTLTATITLQPFTTTNLAEGTNLYYTDARVRLALSAGTGISYDNTTGVITNSDRGSSQFIFKNVAVTGSDLIVADSNDDTITFTAGSGVTLSSNAGTDTITISATGTGGTVTSVGLTAPTGFAVSGSPVTGSGTLSLAFAAGYALPTTASQANWDDAYNNKITAVSFNSGTLTLTQQDTGTLTTSLDGRYILLSEKAAANGVATLDGSGKIPSSQLPSSVFEYKGLWNAATNTPTLADGTGDPGDVYQCSVAGTVNFGSGPVTFAVGDLVIYDGTEWQKSDSTSEVLSVNGAVGVVVLTTTDIGEGTNLYFTDARARTAISGGTGISYNNTTGTITNSDLGSSQTIFKNIEVAGQSTVTAEINNDTLTLVAGTNISITTNATTDTITINSTDQFVGTVTSVDMSVPTGFTISGNPITSAGTLGLAFASGYSLPTNTSQSNWDTAYNNSITNFGYNTSNGVLTLTQQDAGTLTATVTLQPFSTTNLAEGTNLYFTDARARTAISLTTSGTSGAATYNNTTGVFNIPQYQAALTNPVTGTGTTNYVAKWSSSSAITDSLIFDNGTNVGISNATPGEKLDITGNARVSSYYLFSGNPGNPGGSTASIYDQAGIGPTISGLNVAFRTGSTPAETMRITDGGNVGIGTTSPGAKLDVRGGVIFNGGTNSTDGIKIIGSLTSSAFTSGIEFIRETVSGGSKIQPLRDIAIGGVGFNFLVTANNTDEINATYTTAAVITNAGNVGIGTTSPASQSGYVAETINGTNGSFTEYRQNGTALFRIGADSNRPFLYGMTNANMDFYTNTAQRMRIDNAGNVLIGTTQNYTRLTVSNGNNTRTGVTLSDADTSSLMLFAGASTIASINFDTFGLRFLGGSTAGVDNGTEIMRLTTSYNVLIGTTTDAGEKLQVSGTSSFSDVITFAGNTRYGVSKVYNASIGDMFGLEQVSSVQTGTGAATRIFADDAANNFISLGKYTNATAFTDLFRVRTDTGAANLGLYGAGTFTGTAAYNLAVDASGNIIETAGGVVDGSGTANYVTKWLDSNTIANSQMVDNGTNVGIDNSSPKTKFDISGQIGFGSKSMTMTDSFADALSVNMSIHTGCYVKITAFGDWGGHSSIAYLGEFFLQNGADGYNEPGLIIRQVDNTSTDDIQAQIVDPAGSGTRNFVIQLKTTSASFTPFTAFLQYEVRGQYNSVS
jgi:hypothetical protein